MSHVMTASGYSPSRRKKPRRFRRLLLFLLFSAVIQILFLYGVERFLTGNNGADELPVTTEVRRHSISLEPSPGYPGTMAVSADHTLLAMMDGDLLRIYNLANGREVRSISLHGSTPGALRWLPDRNRLIYALMDQGSTAETVREPVLWKTTGVKDETYSNETYRTPVYRAGNGESYRLALYSIDGRQGAQPELIQELRQSGRMPSKVNLSLSTYTNLLYVYWTKGEKNHLVQVDIMRRVKDIRLPGGDLTRVVVSPRDGNLWAELTVDNSAKIYFYNRGRWKLQKYLDGYRLLGAAPDGRLAVAAVQVGQARKVLLVDQNGKFNPGWVFRASIRPGKADILSDGRLIYFENSRTVTFTPQLGKETVFGMAGVDSYSPDGKMLVSWRQETNRLNIMEEVEARSPAI